MKYPNITKSWSQTRCHSHLLLPCYGAGKRTRLEPPPWVEAMGPKFWPRQLELSEKSELHKDRTSEICKGFPLRIQQNTDQSMHGRELPKAREKISEKHYRGNNGQSSTRAKNSAHPHQLAMKNITIHGALGRVLRKILLQEWSIISPRLNTIWLNLTILKTKSEGKHVRVTQLCFGTKLQNIYRNTKTFAPEVKFKMPGIEQKITMHSKENISIMRRKFTLSKLTQNWHRY